ncbi:hypothetical protein CH380_11720 [Leptospira adleri]|uniref:Uncharacterized protein n=1 Tax=Leptospira adleri TaxID=2023186 RepID=A0A2M9YNE9_9LEPT|nr:hypothetical protein CH380_11720 [Leptospira adleri]PJZ59638.1 hypothetical protein CH376_22640 [Leptospira adleri]
MSSYFFKSKAPRKSRNSYFSLSQKSTVSGGPGEYEVPSIIGGPILSAKVGTHTEGSLLHRVFVLKLSSP